MESPRPLLAIPHLLNQESACAYHGYLLALMAVEQTRAYFLRRDGYLTDNPRIGPDLAAHYWGPGNGMTHDETLQSPHRRGVQCGAAGRGVQPECRRGVATGANMHGGQAAAPTGRGGNALDAHIRVVHGAELIADNSESRRACWQNFEA